MKDSIELPVLSGKKKSGSQIEKDWKRAQTLGLQFCWHIRVGFFREIGIEKMRSYAGFFYDAFMDDYLSIQEALIRSSSVKDPVRKKIIAGQKRLRRIFSDRSSEARCLYIIEDRLEDYLRLEQKFLMTSLDVQNENRLMAGQGPYSTLISAYEDKLSAWQDKYWELR